MRVMKIVGKELKRKGVTMKRFYDNFPLCCPSRSTILTGQYAHNHHVLSNSPPDGGYGVFNELHGDNNLPTVDAGGRATRPPTSASSSTATRSPTSTAPSRRDVPTGWDNWHVLAPSRAQYFGYTLNNNGSLRQYSEDEEDYSTDVFTQKAQRFIRSNAKAQTPFFLELGYAAPHGGGGGEPGRSCNRAAVPAPRHLSTLKGKFRNTLPPSFNEARRLRQAVDGRREGGADPGPDLRHAAQAPLRLGVAARASTRASARCSRRSSATGSSRTPTSSSSPTTASCAGSTGSATTSATSTRSRRGSRSSPAGPGSRTARAPTTWSSTPT